MARQVRADRRECGGVRCQADGFCGIGCATQTDCEGTLVCEQVGDPSYPTGPSRRCTCTTLYGQCGGYQCDFGYGNCWDACDDVSFPCDSGYDCVGSACVPK